MRHVLSLQVDGQEAWFLKITCPPELVCIDSNYISTGRSRQFSLACPTDWPLIIVWNLSPWKVNFEFSETLLFYRTEPAKN